MTQHPKKMKAPYFMPQNIDKNTYPTTKVNKKLMEVFRPLPADLVSKVKISVGTNQVIGPQDQAYPATKSAAMAMAALAALLGSPPLFKYLPMRPAKVIIQIII